MPRPKKPVILRQGNAIKKFDSIASAASFLGVCPATVNQVLKHKQRRNTVRGFQAEYDNETPPAPKKEKNVTHYEVEIEGKTFVSQDGSQEKNCTTCAIYKLKPPLYMTMYPLCYEYSCHKHKIYELCASHDLTWKEK